MKIQDGKGTGTHAEVGHDHRLKTAAVTSDRAVEANVSGSAFMLTTPIINLPAATETVIAYLENTDTQASMVIDLERILSDMGSTNNNKPFIFRCYIDSSPPTANNNDKDPVSTNTGGSGRPSVDFQVWDEVGAGLTQAVPGDLLMEGYHNHSPSDASIPSKLILGPSKALTYSLECTEASKVSIHIFAHIESEES